LESSLACAHIAVACAPDAATADSPRIHPYVARSVVGASSRPAGEARDNVFGMILQDTCCSVGTRLTYGACAMDVRLVTMVGR
jgi:hypothetical protein